jgi:hypothetical protein
MPCYFFHAAELVIGFDQFDDPKLAISEAAKFAADLGASILGEDPFIYVNGEDGFEGGSDPNGDGFHNFPETWPFEEENEDERD